MDAVGDERPPGRVRAREAGEVAVGACRGGEEPRVLLERGNAAHVENERRSRGTEAGIERAGRDRDGVNGASVSRGSRPWTDTVSVALATPGSLRSRAIASYAMARRASRLGVERACPHVKIHALSENPINAIVLSRARRSRPQPSAGHPPRH